MAERPPRRIGNSRDAAEAAFKAATTKTIAPAHVAAPRAPVIPNARELVTLRMDREVLDHFQKDGPGWQERINAALRTIAGK